MYAKTQLTPDHLQYMYMYEFPLSWIKKQLKTSVTRHLKKWANLARSANSNIPSLPNGKEGSTYMYHSSRHSTRVSRSLASHNY